MIKKSKFNGRILLSHLIFIGGMIMVIKGILEPGITLESNTFLFGLIMMLFSVHILNLDDIDKLEKRNKK